MIITLCNVPNRKTVECFLQPAEARNLGSSFPSLATWFPSTYQQAHVRRGWCGFCGIRPNSACSVSICGPCWFGERRTVRAHWLAGSAGSASWFSSYGSREKLRYIRQGEQEVLHRQFLSEPSSDRTFRTSEYWDPKFRIQSVTFVWRSELLWTAAFGITLSIEIRVSEFWEKISHSSEVRSSLKVLPLVIKIFFFVNDCDCLLYIVSVITFFPKEHKESIIHKN